MDSSSPVDMERDRVSPEERTGKEEIGDDVARCSSKERARSRAVHLLVEILEKDVVLFEKKELEKVPRDSDIPDICADDWSWSRKFNGKNRRDDMPSCGSKLGPWLPYNCIRPFIRVRHIGVWNLCNSLPI
ncbi:hypothetical protein Droror1_Dr00009076 [Drosera rotundifolia]